MKKIIEIFKNDIKSILKSRIGIVIILGVIFIPGIYAWLNIDSNWGPYDNTGNIPIAIVNKDNGAEILGENVNIGEKLEKSLKENNSLKWIFTSEEDAKKNVDKSNYYGAIIIPEDFSKNMSSILDDSDLQKPVFDFYVNNKKNPIAPIIVNKAVGAIQTTVNESFVNEIAFKLASAANDLDLINKTDTTTDDLIKKLKNVKTNIHQMQLILNTTSSAGDSTISSLKSIREITPIITDSLDNASNKVDNIEKLSKTYEDAYNDIENNINNKLDNSKTSINDLYNIINATNNTNIDDNYNKIVNLTNESIDNLKTLDNLVVSLNKTLNNDKLNNIHNDLTNIISELESIKSLINTKDNALNNLDTIKEKINSINSDFNNKYNEYKNTINNNIDSNINDVTSSLDNLKTSINKLNTSVNSFDTSLKYMIDALNSGKDLNKNINELLESFDKDIDSIINIVYYLKGSEIYNNIVNILKNNPEVIADFISTPVETNLIDIYPISSYGAKMAPFYSILACWVGSTILSAILKTDFKKNKAILNASISQRFLGRFMLFGILAMLQGLVIGLGDLVLRVQTINIPIFLFTMILSSFVFALLIYSLSVVFGKVGQALSIVLLVIQVAGSGGTFPIELLPRFFQILQPFMPFYPAMNALRETIGGFYGFDYLIYILLLLCHTIIPILLIVVFSKYSVGIRQKLEKSLEKTGIIG